MGLKHRVLLVTGADAGFGDWMFECLSSLDKAGVLSRVDLAVLDQGLSSEQLSRLAHYAAQTVVPEWPDFVPLALRDPKKLGLVARPFLRDYFPGYDCYLWFDADAWAQSGAFLDAYVDAALREGAAVAQENGAGYRKSLMERRWWIGNHVLAFGPLDGIKLSFRPSINIGILALAAQAPHWEEWVRHYVRILERTGKVNLDQHAFHAAVHLGGFTTAFMPAALNWLPILSTPSWDARSGLLCVPTPAMTPISIVHLAGPDKAKLYRLHGTDETTTSLQYSQFINGIGRAAISNSATVQTDAFS